MGNRGKKFYAFILFIAVVTFFFNQNYVQAGIFEDPVNGYSFEYPFGWKAQGFPNSKNLIKGEINKGKDIGVQIRIYPTKGDLRNFTEWYVEDFMQQMQKHWGGNMVVFDQQFTIVARHECFVVSFDFTRRDNKRWFFKQYLWPIDKGILILQSGTLFKLRLLNEPEIDSIARSLRFIK